MDVDIAIVTHAGATTGEDGPRPQIQLARQKKVLFDINAEKDTFFEARNAIGRNLGKLLAYEIPTTFDTTLVAGPS